MAAELAPSLVLVGLESAGKSALFRGLSGRAAGDEANFRGSTVVCRRWHSAECRCDIVDTPGIRVASDSATTTLALDALSRSDAVLLVLRAPQLRQEMSTLLNCLQLQGRRVAVAITFADKMLHGLEAAAQALRTGLGVPVVTLNAREMSEGHRVDLLAAIRDARALPATYAQESKTQLQPVFPASTVFEHATLGAPAALLSMLALLALPVVAAFALASWLQPVLDQAVLAPLTAALSGLPALLTSLLVGPYGLLTLGSYSFLWASPVVLLLGASTSVLEETGLHDRITAALDPWLRVIGLSGRDLSPVITGFGCNVVAVLHTRACSACSRKACVSLISFGSACSYQIGASLSLFGSAGKPMLFAPYLLLVFVVGALHTRLWHSESEPAARLPLRERAFLTRPTASAVLWRLRVVMRQFLTQAMPIFLLLCVLSAALDYSGALQPISRVLAPVMALFQLPSELSLSLVVSVLRKDGMLLMNSGNGETLRSLSSSQLFLAVYLSSTLTACIVTLWTVQKELGLRHAALLAGRQALTSVVTAFLLALALMPRSNYLAG